MLESDMQKTNFKNISWSIPGQNVDFGINSIQTWFKFTDSIF